MNNINYNNEIWKPFPGYETFYKISNFGRVLSLRTNKNTILKQSIRHNGYCYISLYNLDYSKMKRVNMHRAVARAFLSTFDDKLTVNHKDFNTSNNHIDNLECITKKENIQYSHKAKRFPIGEKHYNAKITNKQATEIIRLSNQYSSKNLADIFKTTIGHINRILSGNHSWKHLDIRKIIPPKNRKKTSRFNGVSQSKTVSKNGIIKIYWRSLIYFKYRAIHLGSFLCETDAAKAYDKKAIELFGNKAKLNFPEIKEVKDKNI